MALRKRAIVVGLGSIGRRHARLLHERGDIEVQFCEPNDEMLDLTFREVGNLPVHGTFEGALDAKPDFVVIATPHQFHRDQSVKAMDKSIHVLCEKPMSDRLEDAFRMKRAAERSDAILSIGFMLHFNPGLLRVKNLIESGTLGQVLAIQYKVGSYITLVNSRSRYQADMEGAVLMDYAHQPDTINWLLGKKPKGVFCTATQGGDLEFSSNPNVLTMVCDYQEPLIATIMLNYLQMPERQECEVVGDQGWVLFDVKQGEIRIGNKEKDDFTIETIHVVRDEMFQNEHQVFLDAIEGKGDPSCPPEEAIVSMQIIEAAMSSWKKEQRIEL